MLAKKTIGLVNGFQSKDWKQLMRWLESPVHTTDAGLERLASYLQDLAPAYPPESLRARPLWEVLYPDKPLNKGVLRVKIRQLTKQVEDYLIWREYQRDSALRNRLLSRALGSVLPFTDFEKAAAAQLRKISNGSEADPNQSYHQLELHYSLVDHPDYDNYADKGRHLRELNASLDIFFTLCKFRLLAKMENRKRIRGEQYDITFKDEIRSATRTGQLAAHPVIVLYQRLFDFLEAPGNDPGQLRESFKDTFNRLSSKDREIIFYTALNQLNRQVNQGGEDTYSRALTWYHLGLDTGLLLRNGRISHITFSNIALLGYRGRKFTWVENFIAEYADLLPEEHRTDALIDCRATGAFHHDRFQRCIELIKDHKFGPAYALRIRLTRLRAYFELLSQGYDVYEDMDRALQRFEAYLKRNRTYSEAATLPYRNHLRLLRKLLSLQSASKVKRASFAREIQDIDPLVAKSWLLHKVAL